MSWKEENDTLVKEFGFGNFSEAVGFINKIKDLADKADHHPDILIHSYNKVRVILTTHSEGKVTDKDHSLAWEIDGLVE